MFKEIKSVVVACVDNPSSGEMATITESCWPANLELMTSRKLKTQSQKPQRWCPEENNWGWLLAFMYVHVCMEIHCNSYYVPGLYLHLSKNNCHKINPLMPFPSCRSLGLCGSHVQSFEHGSTSWPHVILETNFQSEFGVYWISGKLLWLSKSQHFIAINICIPAKHGKSMFSQLEEILCACGGLGFIGLVVVGFK